MPGCSNKGRLPDFIIIQDDDGGSAVEDKSNHGGAKMYGSSKIFCSSAVEDSKVYRQFPSKLSVVSSDEEDCVVMEPSHSRKCSSSSRGQPDAKKMPTGFPEHGLDSKPKGGRLSDSDSDVIVDCNGSVRRHWEEAVLRKRMGSMLNNSSYRAESEESASMSKSHNNEGKQCFTTKQTEEWPQFRDLGHPTDQSSNPEAPPAGLGSSTHEKEGKHLHTVLDQDSNVDSVDAQSDDAINQPVAPRCPPAVVMTCVAQGERICRSSEHHGLNLDACANAVVQDTTITETEPIIVSKPVEACLNGLETETEGDISTEDLPQSGVAVRASGCLCVSDRGNMQDAETDSSLEREYSVLNGREKLKESEEFREAVAEEWARRRLELRKQAEEAVRERKRRKRQAERRLDMEIRQRQRIEEVRQSQQKEEQTLDFKERVRGEIRSKLEHVAAMCRDMASLLHRLGIPVDGGSFPTTQQVNAAYKKALFRFHPDRVAAMVKRDLLLQVEAEETFKLILRMKDVLPAVATRSF